MKARPLLMKGPLVLASLAGKKTQTRRIVKARKDVNSLCHLAPCEIAGEINQGAYENCPYGQPGDLLWVREMFSYLSSFDFFNPSVPRDIPPAWYWADGNPKWGNWTRPAPSIHMPRWVSRLTLEIVSVRAERLNNISEADAIAEGVDWRKCPSHQTDESFQNQPAAARIGMCAPYVEKIDYQAGFQRLWQSINGEDSWDENPWVWVIEYRAINKNVDEVLRERGEAVAA